MKKLVEDIIILEYENLEKKLNKIPLNKQVGLIVLLNNIKYEFLIHIKSTSDSLLCLGPSGLPNKQQIKEFKSRPFFSRHSWKFNDSTIFYNDNTRYVWNGAIGAGWGIGLPNDYFLENMKNILLKIFNFFHIKQENIIFYGSSMGGFTSIQLATMIKNSHAIAENPQIDAKNWMKRVYLKNNFYSDLYDDKTLELIEPYRYNVIEMIKKENYVPYLTIINCISSEDINYHLSPFIKELVNLPFKSEDYNKINIIIEPTKKHQPLSYNQLNKIIKLVKSKKNETYLDDSYYKQINKAIPLIKKMKLFDKKYYSKNNIEISNLDPLTHYLLKGWKEGKNPSEKFDNNYYLEKYPDVKIAGMNPLVHYVCYGINENRKISENQTSNNKTLIQRIKDLN